MLLQHHNLLPTKWLPHFNHNNVYQSEDFERLRGSVATFKMMLPFSTTEDERENLQILFGITSDILNEKEVDKKQQFFEYLKILGLTNKFPKRLKMKDARMLHPELLENATHTEQIKILPYLILQKIFMFDYHSRGVLFKGELKIKSVYLKEIKKIHPLDSILVLLQCCDNFLRQEIFSKLSTCQMAIPILLPNPYNGSIVFPLWAMRSIIKSWNNTFESKMCRFTDYPAPVISFLKIGELKYSKSKLINAVINDSNQNYFFNWECEGSTTKRLFVDGLGEMCCYLPSGEDDFYQDVLIFLNLRGSALNHIKQVNFIKQISFIIFLLLDEDRVDEEIVQFLRELSEISQETILLFPKLECDQPFKNKKIEASLSGLSVIKMAGKPGTEIKHDIRGEILLRLNHSKTKDYRKLTDFGAIAREMQIQVDEDNEECKNGKSLAEEVMINIKSVSLTEAKSKMLPIQGPDLWQKWAELNKESYRKLDVGDSLSIDTRKKEIRQSQNILSQKPTTVMKVFLYNLLESVGTGKLYYLQWLKTFLDDYSRQVLPQLETACQNVMRELTKAIEKNKNFKTKGNSQEVERLKKKLEQCNEDLVHASFGLEHLFREIGQTYEARMDPKLNVAKKLEDEVACYPQLIAELMEEGYPVELMDGDASHVPVTWVSAVLNELKILHGEDHPSKLFIISVLGMQNSGKSTLLNTMFGLHFNVSAGRCTRGAYFQLLPLSDALIEQTNCHYIMVVDTEGLCAPELHFKESSALMHDNELATFVIGIADMTIINIYGLTPGDLANILGNSVNAFIRMKEIEMNFSCHFVHQNVTAIMAEKEGRLGKQRFQDKLDILTRVAAKIRNLDEKYSSFQDVIHFNNEKDVTYFPGLLQGNPPMAPVNPGYSDRALSLKKKLINHLQTKKSGYFTFSDFQCRVSKLWEAILRDKYVFSFKDTLTLIAYNELDKHLCDWSWTLNRKMMELQFTNAKTIKHCKASQLNTLVQKCLADNRKDLDTTYLELSKKLDNFFKNSDKANTLIQWKTQTEIKLRNMLIEQKDAAKHHCEILKVIRERDVQVDEIKMNHRQQLNESIFALAQKTTIAEKSHSQRQEIFDMHWKQWLDKLHKVNKTELFTSEKTIDETVRDTLQQIFNENYARVIMLLQQKPLAERGNVLIFQVDSEKHLTLTKSFTTLLLFKIGKQDDKGFLNEANLTTETFLSNADNAIQQAVAILHDYNKDVVYDILMTLKTSVEKHNEASKSYKFTPEYSIDIAVLVASYAARTLKEMVKKLKIENDPVNSLNNLKQVFLNTFESQFTAALKDETAADNLCALLVSSIRKALVDILRIEIVEDMRSGPQFKRKKYFIAQILEDLANEHDFDLYKTYLKNSAKSFRYWAKAYVDQHCQRKYNGETKLVTLAKVHLQTIIKNITKATYDLKEQYTVTGDSANDTNTEPYCEGKEDSMDYSTNHDEKSCIEMTLWLEGFFEKLNKTLSIDSQEVQQMIGIERLKNLDIFTQQFIKNLGNEKDKILQELIDQSTDITRISKWNNPPYLVLCNTLIGCTEQCPFCQEQCEITDPDHLALGKAHFTETHRLQCLGTYIWVKDSSLILDTCSELIETDKQFRKPDTDPEEFIPYKDYKTIYQNWLISNEKPRSGPIYWQWFFAEFNTEMVEWVGSSITSVPSSWKLLTKDDAIGSLSELYGSKINT